MTRFTLTCSSGNKFTLRGYARDINDAKIPGAVAIMNMDGDVWLEIETLDALLAVKQTLDLELILTESPKGDLPCIEVYNDWRE